MHLVKSLVRSTVGRLIELFLEAAECWRFRVGDVEIIVVEVCHITHSVLSVVIVVVRTEEIGRARSVMGLRQAL